MAAANSRATPSRAVSSRTGGEDLGGLHRNRSTRHPHDAMQSRLDAGRSLTMSLIQIDDLASARGTSPGAPSSQAAAISPASPGLSRRPRNASSRRSGCRAPALRPPTITWMSRAVPSPPANRIRSTPADAALARRRACRRRWSPSADGSGMQHEQCRAPARQRARRPSRPGSQERQRSC